MENKIAYKGFNVNSSNQLYCRDYMFEVGKEHSLSGKLRMCGNGFHFCWELNNIHEFYNLGNSVICEVEILGDILNDSDMKKSCTNKLKILRILTKDDVLKISNNGVDNTGYVNTGNMNTGNMNTGNRNTGNMNTGDMNTGNMNNGNRNTGDMNTGDTNTGDRNTGNMNTGDWNTGDMNTGNVNTGDTNTGDMNTGNMNNGNRNTGDMNTGDRNTGNRNTGDTNTGNRNTGNRNTGNRNTGDWNTGDWNQSDFNNGFFNTKDISVYIFNKPTGMTAKQFYDSKYHRALCSQSLILTDWIDYTDEEKSSDKAKELIGGYLKQYDYQEACETWWNNLTEENKEIIKQIPNFDAEVFFEITGIDLRQIQEVKADDAK